MVIRDDILMTILYWVIVILFNVGALLNLKTQIRSPEKYHYYVIFFFCSFVVFWSGLALDMFLGGELYGGIRYSLVKLAFSEYSLGMLSFKIAVVLFFVIIVTMCVYFRHCIIERLDFYVFAVIYLLMNSFAFASRGFFPFFVILFPFLFQMFTALFLNNWKIRLLIVFVNILFTWAVVTISLGDKGYM